MPAIIAQRHIDATNLAQRQSTERISSGSKINRAADDAAGLAITERMRAQIRSIRQDVRNANDGISMIQTAEGAMTEVGNILVRFREVSMQAASDTISDIERGFIDKEVQQLKQEMDRIALSTEFGGRKLLAGQGDTISVQVGLNNNSIADQIAFDTSKLNVSADGLGLADFKVTDRDGARENLSVVDEASRMLVENRAELGALQNRFQSTVNNLTVYNENLTEAQSRIKDTDIAEETSNMIKSQILQQAGVAILSQANSSNMLALKLIS
jgi:flagellin